MYLSFLTKLSFVLALVLILKATNQCGLREGKDRGI